MNRTSSGNLGGNIGFVMHVPSGRAGAVIAARSSESTSLLTVRLAEGNLMTAPAAEFRPATEDEVARYHHEAAMKFPAYMTPRTDLHFREPRRDQRPWA